MNLTENIIYDILPVLMLQYMDVSGFEYDGILKIDPLNKSLVTESHNKVPEYISKLAYILSNESYKDITRYIYSNNFLATIVNKIEDNFDKFDITNKLIQTKIAIDIDIDNLMVTYLPIHKYLELPIEKARDINFIYSADNKLRVKAKIGKFLNVLKHNELYEYQKLNDSQIEKLINSIKLSTKLNSGLKFIESDPCDIEKYYSTNNITPGYDKCSLVLSCMSDIDSSFLSFNKSFAYKILVLLDSDDKLCGRAIIWKCKNLKKEPFIMMDKVYVSNEHLKPLFVKYAATNGYLFTEDINDTYFIEIDKEIFYNIYNFGVLDTFEYYVPTLGKSRMYSNLDYRKYKNLFNFNDSIFRMIHTQYGEFKNTYDNIESYKNYLEINNVINKERLTGGINQEYRKSQRKLGDIIEDFMRS